MSGSAGFLLGIVRLNSDGTDDTSFGSDGRSQFRLPATGQYLGADVIRQTNGRLVMVGSFRANNSSRSNLLLTRFDAATPAGPATSVFVAANGQIQIRDNWSRGDALSLQVVGTNLQIQDLTTDSQAVLAVSGLPEVTGSGTKSILIPLSRIQQTNLPLLLDTRAGDDTVTLTSDVSDAGPVNITVAAGLGTDKLIQTSYSQGAIWNLNSAGSGSVKPDGIATPRAFSSVEHFVGGPLTDEFCVQAGTTPTWMLIDGVAGANDLIQITGDADMKLTNTLAEIRGGITQNITIANFERATLNGGVSANFLDSFFFSGNVTLRGGDGNDKLVAGSGNDTLRGDAGNDVLIGSAGNDVLVGGDGDDMLIGANGNDQLSGEAGRDILEGGSGSDILRGGSGEDILISGSAYGLQNYYYSDLDRDNIRAAWSDATLSYEQRVVAIRDTGVGTTAPLSRLTVGYSVFPDRDLDQLFGDGDRDWFFATTVSTGSLDLFADRNTDEELTLLN